MFSVGSLFSGIGGLDLGLERAGMAVKWQVEIDGYCRRVLAKHWPDVKRYKDVREVGQHNLEPVDLICGGFPCQPVSHAGQRKGTADERWLWPEFARLVREMRPRWVLAENVPGLLSIDAGRVFGGILRDLAACGYDAEWDCLPACAVGAPHIRDRVFVLGHANDQGEPVVPVNDEASRVSNVVDADADGRESANGRRLVSDGERFGTSSIRQDQQQPGTSRASAVAHHDRTRQPDIQGQRAAAWSCRSAFAGADHRRPDGEWCPEPDVGRVADGVPNRVYRLRGLGNAVVPAVAEWIGRRIIMVQNIGIEG